MVAPSVADPDPGSGAFLTPRSEIQNRFFCIPDPGFQTHIFESLVRNFWVKSSIILRKLTVYEYLFTTFFISWHVW